MEEKQKNKMNPKDAAKRVAVCGIFGGLALVLYLIPVLRIPLGFIFNAAPFLKLNFSDIPVMIAGFAYGPVVGMIIVVIKSLTKCLMTSSGFVGELADFIVSLTFVLPAAIIYHFKKSKKGALIGLAVGTIVSTIAACFTNWLILLPMYHWKGNYAYTIFAGILPFNLVKNVLISVLVLLIYKKISNIISKLGAK